MNTTIFVIVLDMLAMHGQVNAAPVQEDQKSIRSFLNLTSLLTRKPKRSLLLRLPANENQAAKAQFFGKLDY